MKHAPPFALPVVTVLMALLAIPGVALASDSKVTLNIKETVASVTVWRHGLDPKAVILLTPTVADIVYGEGTTWVGGGKTVDVMVFRMPSGNLVLFTDQGNGFTETPIRADAFVLTVEMERTPPTKTVTAKPAAPVKSIPPTIAFDLSRSSGTVTGAQCMDIVIASDIDIPKNTMVYEIETETKYINSSNRVGISGESAMYCSWSIRYPHEVKVVYAQVFLESRERVVYRCDRVPSEFSDGHFPCSIKEVDAPLPDMAKVAKEDGLFFLYYGNRESRGFRSGKIEIKSTVDIPRRGLFLRGRNASDTRGFEIWPDYLPRIEAGVFETIEIYNWVHGSPNIFLGWAVSEDKKMRYLYCDKNYEDVTVCGSWAKPTH